MVLMETIRKVDGPGAPGRPQSVREIPVKSRTFTRLREKGNLPMNGTMIRTLVAFTAVLLPAAFCAGRALAAAEIPYPAALDAAAVVESRITDLNREALIVGNGDINALIWQADGALCLRIAKNDIWDARVDTSQDPAMLKVDVANQKWAGGGGPPSWGKPYPAPRCAAVVRITPGMSGGAGQAARLDLRRATAAVGDVTVRALADRNVFLIETDRPVSLEEIKSAVLPAAEQGETDGVKWLQMKMPGDMDYAGMQYALALAANGRRKAVAVVTSLDTKQDVRAAAVRLAQETAAAEPATLIAAHEAEWTRYWSASGVQLDDPDFQLWWYRLVYMLRCFSKPGVVPAGLWAFQPTNAPAWHGDYHHNYNAWQPYWTAFIINHPAQAEPWVDYMNEMLPRLKWLAKTTYGCEGAFVGISSFAFEPDPAHCRSVNSRQIMIPPYGYTLGMIGMSAQVLWHHHLYQPDRKYLAEKIYPVIREAALFYCSFAEKCPRDENGKAKFGPSFSPEHGSFGVRDVPFDLAYARYSIKAALAAAEQLGRDGELAARFRKALDLLPDYPTAPDADGKPIVVDWTGCKFREIKQHNITVPAVPVFPAEQVTWFSPEPEKELFRNTIRQTRHRGCNSTVMLSVAKARLSMPEAIGELRSYYKPLVQPNGMLSWPMHGYYLCESVGIAAAISEFLLQSADDIIRVFPAWPKEADAAFTNLRAQGGFLVSAKQKAGKVVKLEITATAGGKLRLLDPRTNKIIEQDTRPEEKLTIIP
jgi:hypothetical protein